MEDITGIKDEVKNLFTLYLEKKGQRKHQSDMLYWMKYIVTKSILM
jgi:hypothetical protein